MPEDGPVPDGSQGELLPGQGSPGTSGYSRNQNRNRKASSFPRQRQVGEEGWASFSHPCTVLGGDAGGRLGHLKCEAVGQTHKLVLEMTGPSSDPGSRGKWKSETWTNLSIMPLIWTWPHAPGKWGQQAPGRTTGDLHLDGSSPGIQTLRATVQGPFQLLPTEVSEGYFVFFKL